MIIKKSPNIYWIAESWNNLCYLATTCIQEGKQARVRLIDREKDGKLKIGFHAKSESSRVIISAWRYFLENYDINSELF